MQTKLPFITMLLLISFASVNATLFTPALPAITHFFDITENSAHLTITWYLVGYALGQLIYGPLANRFGRKPAIYAGIILQIVSSLICAAAGMLHEYWLLVMGRCLLAMGSGVGLKMTFTLVNECYEPTAASQKISYLMLAFAITPGLGMAVGGILNTYYGWTSCFYAGAIYGLLLLFLVTRLPETQKILNLNAFKLKHLVHGYSSQFKNLQLVASGLVMGICTCFVYVFATLAPFIAITLFGMKSAEYGLANIIPPIGFISGSLIGARLAKDYSLQALMRLGIVIAIAGGIVMLVALLLKATMLVALFMPMAIIYFGLCFVIANASTIAMSNVVDKAHGSAVMNFINIGLATLVVLSLGLFPIKPWLLPVIYLLLCIAMLGIMKWITRVSDAEVQFASS